MKMCHGFHLSALMLSIIVINASAYLEENIVTYDSNLFLSLIGSQGLIWAWFMFLIARFLIKIKFQVNRIPSYLLTRSKSGANTSVLQTLFSSYHETPSNAEFRAHLYHAWNIIQFLIILPVFLILSWGFSCAVSIQPPALGYGVAFIGSSGIVFWFAFQLWEQNKYRMTPTALFSFSISVALFLCFAISVVFEDISVLSYGRPLNFPSLSLVFGTINTMPLLIIVFQQDKNYKVNLELAINKIDECINESKQSTTKNTTNSTQTV